MTRLSIVAAAFIVNCLASGLASCAPLPEERPTTPAVPAPRPRLAEAPRKAPVHLVFEQIEGAEAARTRAVFAPISTRVTACRPGKGVVHLRLVSDGSKAQYTVGPKTTLVGYERRCVLETLSTLEIEGMSGDANAAARPPGFTVLFSIEW